MKIRLKLLILIFPMLFAMIVSQGVFIGFQRIVDLTEIEKNELLQLKDLIQQQHISLSRMIFDGIVVANQVKTIRKTIEKKEEALCRVKNITFLPKVSEKIRLALVKILLLNELQVKKQNMFFESVNDLLVKIEDSNISIISFSFDDLYSDAFIENGNNKIVYPFVKSTKAQIFGLENALSSSEIEINKQYEIIDAQINHYQKLAYFITAVFTLISLIFSVILTYVFADKIAKSVQIISSSLSIMASGDLTKEILVKSHDEIGTVSIEMNNFQEGLNESLSKIKDYAYQNRSVKEELIATASETSASVVEMSSNINSVSSQMSILDNNIINSSSEINEISLFTSELSNHIEEQSVMIEESTASITEMIASINSVSILSEKNQIITKSLIETAKEGDEKLLETTVLIEEINSSISEINNMTGIIQNISSQTNLLAMNAAIEAAHAGENGKGFAVVADEIRKLSKASAKNTIEITKNLKVIIRRIETASFSGKYTRQAFSNINENIKNVSEALIIVSSSTQELNMGGKQILEAMSSLREISTTVQEKSEIVSGRAKSATDIIKNVSEISSEVTSSISGVDMGFSNVTEAMTGLKDISNRVGAVSEKINDSVKQFKTN